MKRQTVKLKFFQTWEKTELTGRESCPTKPGSAVAENQLHSDVEIHFQKGVLSMQICSMVFQPNLKDFRSDRSGWARAVT